MSGLRVFILALLMLLKSTHVEKGVTIHWTGLLDLPGD